MPIDVDRFEAAEDLRDPPTSERVVRFLAEHDGRAYTRGELADAVGASPETVGTNLTRLKERGFVRHREPYWAFADDREHAREALCERYGEAFVADVLGGEEGNGRSRPDEAETATDLVHREVAAAFLQRVRNRLDDAVADLYLFGSVASDAATGDSDVDVLAVVADDADYAAVDDRLLDLAYGVQLEYGVRVEVHSIREEEFDSRRERGDPFVLTVIEEGEAGV